MKVPSLSYVEVIRALQRGNSAILGAEAEMSSITIALPEERLEALKEKATRLKVSPEELVRAGVEEILSRPDNEFERAAEYVFKKNQELIAASRNALPESFRGPGASPENHVLISRYCRPPRHSCA